MRANSVNTLIRRVRLLRTITRRKAAWLTPGDSTHGYTSLHSEVYTHYAQIFCCYAVS